MSERRVLIVDDNLDLAENLAEILELKGFQADYFGRPRGALAAFVPGRYIVALLDIRMPEMDGIELYRALRAADPNLPAIAMTAYARDERLRDALESGMLAVFPKPVDVPRLLAQLSAAAARETAIVIEDDVPLAQNLCEILSDRGFSARSAHTCAEARALLAGPPVSVALVDCRLPDGDGLALVEELLVGRGCSVVVFTGLAAGVGDAKSRAEAAGAQFFEKPIPVQQILAALRKPGAPPPESL